MDIFDSILLGIIQRLTEFLQLRSPIQQGYQIGGKDVYEKYVALTSPTGTLVKALLY